MFQKGRILPVLALHEGVRAGAGAGSGSGVASFFGFLTFILVAVFATFFIVLKRGVLGHWDIIITENGKARGPLSPGRNFY